MTREAHRPAHAAETHVPHEEFVEGERLKIVIADLDTLNLRASAAEAADKQLTDKLNDHGGGLKGFMKKMWTSTWHGNIMRDHYRTKYQREQERTMLDSEDIEAHLSDDVKDKDLVLETTKRWAQAFNEDLRQDLLSEEEAETFGLVLDRNPDGTTNPEGAHLKNELTELMEDYVSGTIPNEDAFNEQAKRILNEAAESGTNSNLIGRGQLYANNLFQIAQNVQAMKMRAESEGRDFSVRETMENADIIIGSAKVGPETQTQLTRVERTVEKLSRVPILNTINEGTLATGVSVVYSLAGWATKTAVGAGAAVFAAGSAAGVWAGLREARTLKQERSLHSREYARGEFASSRQTTDEHGNVIDEVFDLPDAKEMGKRREALEGTRYESKSASELIEQLNLLYNDEGEFRVNDGDSFREALQIIAEIEARNRLSSQREIDLIHFSKGQMSRERRLLRLQLAKAKIDMRHLLEDADDALLTEFGINPDDMDAVKTDPNGSALDFVLEPIRDGNEGVLDINVVGEIDEDIKAKDRLYRRLRNKRVAGAVVKGTVLGVTIGTAMQELVVAPLRDDTQGLLERGLGFDDNPEVTRQTLLDSIFNRDSPVEMSQTYQTIDLPGTGNKVTIPDNLNIEQTGDHTFAINGEDINVSDLKINPDGSLPPETETVLREAGFSFSAEHSFGPPEVINHDVQSNPADILKNHQGQTTTVTRDHWYHNGTPMRWENGKLVGADHNELGLWNPSRDASGNVHIRTNMTENGSWTATERANWQELAREGKLKIALSLSKGTQNEVFMVDINENGEAVIPAGSPVSQFFTQGQGRVDFMGKFTEVVEIRGVDASGKTHIAPLATDIGLGRNTIPDVVTETRPNPITTYSLEYQPNKELDVAVPPLLPWYPRKGLEAFAPETTKIRIIPTSEYMSSYFEGGPRDTEGHLARMSPRLRENDNADVELDQQEELDWYWSQHTPEHQQRITTLVDQTPPMSPDVAVSVAIPVAGHQESNNIYRTLSAYLNQDLERNKFEIMLYVNHPETDKDGRPTSAQATLDEIARFKADYPDMNVQVIYEKLPRSDARIGLIRKNLNDAIARRAQIRGGGDLVVVSNDADTSSTADTYLGNFVEKFEENPNVDALLGQLDWDNETFMRYPEIHVGTRLFLYTSIQYRQFGGGLGSSGANFAFRLKTYAGVGGYNADARVGEDVQLGHAFAAARQGAGTKKPVGFAGNAASRLETSARRSVYVLETFDDAPINQWDYSFGADDDAVRGGVLSRPLPDYTNPADRAAIVTSTENIINRSLKVYGENFETDASGRKRHANKYLERSLRFCGLEFEWDDDGKIHITNADRMFDGLIRFQQKHTATS